MRHSRFKYFHNPDHAQQFLDGAMFCWNAAYYRDYEDAKAAQVVGDEYEGTRLYRPLNGLEITNLTQHTQGNLQLGAEMCQAFCVNGRFFPCAAGILGVGKVGILILDFHFSMAHSFSRFLVFSAKIINRFSRICTRTSANRARLGARPQILAESRFLQIAPLRPAHASASCGTRSPSRIAKRCKAAFQFCTGMVHFFAMCSSAKNSNFNAASGLGNDPRVLITLRSDMFRDSMALVV